MNQHANIVPPNAISSPQQPQSQGSTSSTGSLPLQTPSHTTQSKSESLDNIAKVKSLAGPLRDSLAVSFNIYAEYIFLNRRAHNRHTNNNNNNNVF